MAKGSSKKDLIDTLADFIAHNKGLPVFVGIGLCIVGLIFTCIPGLRNSSGFVGWMVRSDLLLYLGVIVGLLGILLGDAL
jgi:hypothetical protein